MNRQPLCLALSLLLVGAVRLGAQADILAVDQLLIEGPSAQKDIHAVLLARSGFLWIGSRNGLARYDGYRVVPCRLDGVEPGADLPVRGLFEDPGGRLWLATADGLVRYDPDKGTAKRFRHDPRRTDTISSDDLACLHVSPVFPGRLWIASTDGTLDELDLASQRIRRRLSGSSLSRFPRLGRIHAIASDPAGFLWIGAATGLYRFLPADGGWQLIPWPATGPAPQKPVAIKAILRHPGTADSLWIGSEGAGLLRFGPSDGTWQRCLETGEPDGSPDADIGINAIAPFPGEEQNLLLGSENGLYRFEPGTGRCRRLPLFIDGKVMQAGVDIQMLWRDPQGIYWIGSRNDGLCKWSPLQKKFSRYRPFSDAKPNPLANWVTSLQELGDHELLVTTYGGGALVFDRRSHAFRRLALDPGRPGRKLNLFITDSLFGRDGSLWLATGEGMARCSAAGRLQELHAITADKAEAEEILVFAFTQDSQGLIWIGTDRGLVRLDPGNGGLRRYRHERLAPGSLSHDRVNAIVEEPGGGIWVGTEDGLNLYRPQDDRFSVFKNDSADPDSLGSSQVNSLKQDSLGRTWICTANGIDRIERKGGKVFFRHFLVPGGDPGQNLFRSLVEESGRRFWVSTSAGLARFDSERGTFTFYDRRDGVAADGLGEAFFGMRSRDNEIFFSGRNGFVCFRPGEIALNLHPPPVVATGYRVYDNREEIAAGDMISFRPQPDSVAGEKVLRIEFAALDFVRPEKNQYAYRLEGRDAGWIYQGSNRVVMLQDLAVGRHTLRIKAANNEGVWNENGETMPIHVRPSFWERWLFPILGGMFLALLAAYVAWARWRARRLRRASIPDNLDQVAEKFTLSKREAEILRLLLAGKSNKEIEDALFIAMATVKIHVHNIFRKMKVGSRLHLLLRVQQEAKKLT